MLTEVARVPMPTPWGVFDVRAFESPTDHVYLAMVRGNVEHKDGVLVRLHSECLTGDALGSLRCDCGVQLRLAMRRIAAEDCGVLVYATGHEGRGVGAGLVDRLVVGIAPTIIGAGTEAVGTLGITTVADGIRLVDRSVYVLDDDMLLAGDVARCRWV